MNITEYAFTPQQLNVAPGTTVCWRNQGTIAHTATSDTGAFDSGMLDPGQTYSFQFNTEGTYAYHCTPHVFMTGTVNVSTGPPPPPPVCSSPR